MAAKARKSNPERPLCYLCAHRESILGDAHSKCCHPDTSGYGIIQAMMLAMFGSRLKSTSMPAQIGSVRVKLDPHGVNNGWACWPTNFDPIWLKECTGFKKAKK